MEGVDIFLSAGNQSSWAQPEHFHQSSIGCDFNVLSSSKPFWYYSVLFHMCVTQWPFPGPRWWSNLGGIL